jgi:hypothetical protein
VHVAHYLVLFVIFMLPHLGGTLMRRVKRGSERWEHRPESQQRVLSAIPGAIVAIGLLITFDVLNLFQ